MTRKCTRLYSYYMVIWNIFRDLYSQAPWHCWQLSRSHILTGIASEDIPGNLFCWFPCWHLVQAKRLSEAVLIITSYQDQTTCASVFVQFNTPTEIFSSVVNFWLSSCCVNFLTKNVDEIPVVDDLLTLRPTIWEITYKHFENIFSEINSFGENSKLK